MQATPQQPVPVRALAVFLALAFAGSWYGYVAFLLGYAKEGWLNPLGPLVAGLVATAVLGSRGSVREYLGRIVRVKAAPRWYAFAVLVPGAMALAAALPAALLWPEGFALPAAPRAVEVLDRFLVAFFFVSLGEEPGWRGYFLERLQASWAWWKAALAVGAVWAVWHLPLVPREITPAIVPAFVVGVFAASIATAWLYRKTGGSVLLPMLFHAAVNTLAAGLVFPAFTGESLVGLWHLYAAFWAVLAAGLVWSESRLAPGHAPAAGAFPARSGNV